MRRFARPFALAACAAVAVAMGCSDAPGNEDDVTIRAPDRAEAGSAESGPEDPDAGGIDQTDEDTTVIIGLDSGSDGGELDLDSGPDASPCNPTMAFVPVTTATGTACNPGNVLPGTSAAAGLDYACNGTVGVVDGKNVTACVGATFAKSLSGVVVRAASVGKACDTACNTASGLCGTGHSAPVFVSGGGPFKYAGSISLDATYHDFVIPLPAGVTNANQVVVCRAGYGCGRDDVLVQTIRGTCSN